MLDRNEISVVRWMCGFNLKDKNNHNKNKVRALVGLEPISLTVKSSRLS